ncbi:hypothetical protein [Alteromonas sp. 14N.309.X.WAT.G.H12]|uniref:hypothetical protein n=1 Tax=Alteromonas sp. 14N.309.X.WAT.G.H12 TaxID=3120824 RepID=UPI002FCF0290
MGNNIADNTGEDQDAFLGDADAWVAASIDWASYDINAAQTEYEATLSWSLTRTDNQVVFAIGDQSLTYTTEGGNWDAVGVSISTISDNAWVYDYAWLNFTIDEWNEVVLDTPFSYISFLGSTAYLEILDAQMYVIGSLSGTLSLFYELDDASTDMDSLNEDFSVSMTAISYIDDDMLLSSDGSNNLTETQDVPLPPVGILVAGMMVLILIQRLFLRGYPLL